LAKGYLDTNILGHWILYHFRPDEVRGVIPKSVQPSLDLLRLIESKSFTCKFETSDFALSELSQVIRDNLIAAKMMRDGQSLVYFQSLKNYYALEEEEIVDAIGYMADIETLLLKIEVTVSKIKIKLFEMSVPSGVDDFCFAYGVDTSDAMHIIWASRRKCKYFITADRRLHAKLKGVDLSFHLGIELAHPSTILGLKAIRKHGQSE
jgi:hypothetical protein